MSEISQRQASEIQQVMDRQQSFRPVELKLMAHRIRQEGLTPDTAQETQKLLNRGAHHLDQSRVTSHEMAVTDTYRGLLQERIQGSDKQTLENPKTTLTKLDEGLNTFQHALRDAFQRSAGLGQSFQGAL
ncbi:hypothetical protein RIE95_09675 [Acidithiobacillus thiooxidans]|uniref:hypothetical protein n=1 Tax=Acidithiobacillus thiooxidans TaxID=930 RepID=UPI002858A3F1|nr:hypothetical protein [Acidithiobacillus thiooxidans]MDR7927247.1 hypothetical protein [Acidithiobacillus thiooxidans]